MKKLAIIPVIFMLLIACEPEPDEYKLLDQFVVQTSYDGTANFSSYETFSLAVDTLGLVSNNTNDTILIASQSGLVRPILNQVRENMVDRGYVQVPKNSSPDLRMNVFIVNNIDFFQQVVYPGNYYPYYGYGGFGYGYGSSFYYPYVQTYSSNTGALIIEMVDLKNRTLDNKVKVIWTAYMGDIINAVDRLRQSTEGIDQAFVQSTYIQK